MFQKLIVVGRLGGDSEMLYMPDGKAVTSFSVATDRSYKNASGEQVKITTWFRVSVWGKQAEACNTYLNKGSMVLVEGVFNPDKDTGAPRIWTTADGRTGASYEVLAQTVRFLSTQKTESSPIEEDDIPF